jgi:RNA recognition motif-containing protein
MFRDLRLFSSCLSILNQHSLGLRSGVASTSLRFFASLTVFVRNLDTSATSDQVKELMEQFGPVESCHLPETFGMNRGFGFVKFRAENDARRAIAELNDTNFLGKTINVHEQREKQIDPLKIYIKNLPETTWEEVKQYFHKYGEVVYCKVFNKATYTTAIVEFASEESALSAKEEGTADFNGTEIEIGECSSFVERKPIRNQDYNISPDDTRVFVSNIDRSATYDQLKEFFEAVGTVRFVRIIMDKFTGESKGAAIVQFNDSQTAERAIENFNKVSFQSTVLNVIPFQSIPKVD